MYIAITYIMDRFILIVMKEHGIFQCSNDWFGLV